MADTGIDAVKKQGNAEYAKQYRLKRKLLIQQQASTSSEIELRHINNSVLSSIKMEGIRLLFVCDARAEFGVRASHC
jgi:hypothetical protein